MGSSHKLYERARKGISDLSFSDEQKLNTYLPSLKESKSNSNGDKLNFHKYKTAQLLSVKEKSDGTKVETYAVTTMEVAPTTSKNLVSIASDGSKSDSKWDSTIGVKAYSTIYFNNEYDPRGQKHWDMTKITGGWKVDDNRYTLSDMTVTFAQTGWSYWAGGYIGGNKATYHPKGKTFSYTVPSSWKPVVANGSFSYGGSGVGCYMYVKIKKAGSNSWSLSFTNNLGS